MSLKHWPSTDQVREAIDANELAERVKSLPSYQTSPVVLASYTGDINPAIVHRWADFTTAVLAQYPDARLTRELTVVREKTQEELEDAVISDEQSRRYYHPEEYPNDYAEGRDY